MVIVCSFCIILQSYLIHIFQIFQGLETTNQSLVVKPLFVGAIRCKAETAESLTRTSFGGEKMNGAEKISLICCANNFLFSSGKSLLWESIVFFLGGP